ncbi:hypothetical protein DFH05DRAFT_1404488 [Lentinula detonsa]|uniref:Uncharacterized protein n=1 Tax=Lentinula detonsa TaxID=2804962 RepID=A0A9W8NUG9_9AGAR|nr:hypothetical protein DFH05DRAFT_1404488 [Lentinula detonsa]
MVDNEQRYSCKCINVQLQSSTPPTTGAQSNLPPASEWTTVFVPQDEDIKIIYPHLTLRSRHRAPYIPDPTRCARYTTLTCLSCRTLVYRVHQTVLLDDEMNIREGPIITKGWAETEVLHSSSGWLEVSIKDVLVGEYAIGQQKTLPQFSELFGIVLPAASTSPSPSLSPDFESISQPISQTHSIPKYQLPPIPAIFPEPKSTRSLFTVLAAIVTRHSNDLRSEAEEYIDRIVKDKVEEIKRAESQLKRSVLALLTAYSDGIKKAAQEQNALQGGSFQNEPAKESILSPPVSPSTPVFTGVPSSVIRDFIPMRITPSPVTPAAIPSNPSRHASQPAITDFLPRVSALSASLATSSFHHPKARNAATDGASPSSTSPPNPSRTNVSDADSLRSLQSASSATLIAPRKTFEDMDTAASFRYFQLEEEMSKRELEAEAGGKKEAQDRLPARTSAGPNTVSVTTASSSKANGIALKTGRAREVELREKLKGTEQTVDDPSLASPASKGKRKVTFDVKVDTPSNPVPERTTSLDSISEGSFSLLTSHSHMLFDYEEETNGRDASPVVLPFVDYTSQTVSGRPRIHKRNSSGGLPISASLPVPSYIPLAVPSRISPASNAGPNPTQNGSNPVTNSTAPANNSHARTLKRDRQAQILDMLAASLPSHRAAWTGKNYETFLHDAYENDNGDEGDDEEYEDAGDIQRDLLNAGIPSSVPITIHRPNSKPKAPTLSLASYQPNAVLADNMDPPNHLSRSSRAGEKRRSSAALRRTSYADRDAERGVDPGMFDYLLEAHQEEDEEDDMNEGANVNASHGVLNGRSKGRDRAQKILEAQAKSGVPDDEMWRSLI